MKRSWPSARSPQVLALRIRLVIILLVFMALVSLQQHPAQIAQRHNTDPKYDSRER